MSSETFLTLLSANVVELLSLTIAGALVLLDPHPATFPVVIPAVVAFAFLASVVLAIWRDPVRILKGFIVVGLGGTTLSLLGLAGDRTLSQLPSFWICLGVVVTSTAAQLWVARSAAARRHLLARSMQMVHELEHCDARSSGRCSERSSRPPRR